MTAFPAPAARSPDEAALLTAVLADLPSDLPKLVYADWLDDRNNPRSDFLRRFVHASRAGDDLPEPPPGIPAGWLALTGCELLTGLRRHDLTHLTDVLLKLARPCLAMTAERTDDPLPVGASKFGGDPDLPAGAEWPADANGPLPFLAQFNLADVAASPAARELPAAGLLTAFYNGDGWDGDDDYPTAWRLLHTPGDVPLIHTPTPGGAVREYLPLTPQCRLTFTERLDVPDTDNPFADIDLQEEDYGPRHEGYQELRGGDLHHLLGYPRLIQNDVLGRKSCRHLLSLASDNAPGWCWGDWGTLYFVVPAKSLKAGRLAEGVRFEMQCS